MQVNLKAKGVHKSTMTVNKYLKKKRKIICSPDAVSFRSMNDTSSNASSHEMFNLDQESIDRYSSHFGGNEITIC